MYMRCEVCMELQHQGIMTKLTFSRYTWKDSVDFILKCYCITRLVGIMY